MRVTRTFPFRRPLRFSRAPPSLEHKARAGRSVAPRPRVAVGRRRRERRRRILAASFLKNKKRGISLPGARPGQTRRRRKRGTRANKVAHDVHEKRETTVSIIKRKPGPGGERSPVIGDHTVPSREPRAQGSTTRWKHFLVLSTAPFRGPSNSPNEKLKTDVLAELTHNSQTETHPNWVVLWVSSFFYSYSR